MTTSAKLEELNKDVVELTRLSGLATRSKVKDIILIETRKIETEITRLRELAAANKEISNIVTSHSMTNMSKCYDVTLTNYAWDQSDKFVKIFVDLKGVQDLPSDKIMCEFSDDSLNVTVKELNNRNYILIIKNLCNPILPTTSHWKVKKDMVVIFMHKSKETKKWSSLNGTEKPEKKQNDMEPHADPSEGIMNIMKKMYEEGDDDMKRTIAKAWTEGQEKKNPL